MPAKAIVLALLLAALLSPAVLRAAPANTDAAEATRPKRPMQEALWRRTMDLAVMRQASLQSEADFLREVAASIDAWTKTLAAEVCGVFERDDATSRLWITLMTQGSPAFCLHPAPRTPAAGEGLAGTSIHSHVDERVHRQRHPRGVRFTGHRFSPLDIAAGPGYLVHRGRLWHQRGAGTQRFVANLGPLPA